MVHEKFGYHIGNKGRDQKVYIQEATSLLQIPNISGMLT